MILVARPFSTVTWIGQKAVHSRQRLVRTSAPAFVVLM